MKDGIESSHSRHTKLIFICSIQYIHIYYMMAHLKCILYFPKMLKIESEFIAVELQDCQKLCIADYKKIEY